MGLEDVSPDRLAECMVGYQNGKLDAFEELFAALSVPLRNYLTSLTRDQSRGEDLMQETFLQMHRSRHTYMPGRPVKPWAFGIARHVFLMYGRSSARLAKHAAPSPEVPPEIPVAPIAELFPDREDLGQALLDVPEDRRESLLLHHVWGFTFREIGNMLGISERAAKLRAFRGMQDLRQTFGTDRVPA
ncbi:MAG TPA: RNA polymerase sigma factor [Acidobacteriota bacterium]|nr:RNA polymerase sigma factor [Acidobacteriota bacterium]